MKKKTTNKRKEERKLTIDVMRKEGLKEEVFCLAHG
jgi:hypothetical protein